ncbi:MAG: 4Fe-4S binding protein [Candidatus Margulisiibacteriota bacterium]
MAGKAVVDSSICTGCGICVDICPNQALEVVDGIAKLVNVEKCDGNGGCADACPVQAIVIK